MNAATDDPASDRSIRAAERHRISRELHDSASQLLVALQLQLRELQSCPGLQHAAPLFDEIEETLQSIHGTIRQVGEEPADDELEERGIRTAKVFYGLSRNSLDGR